MPIKFTCPHCGKVGRVADQHAGRKVKCPGCQAVVAVPGGAAPPSKSAAGAPELSMPAPPRKRPQPAEVPPAPPPDEEFDDFTEESLDLPEFPPRRRRSPAIAVPSQTVRVHVPEGSKSDAPGVISLVLGIVAMVAGVIGCVLSCLGGLGLFVYPLVAVIGAVGLVVGFFGRGNLKAAGLTLNGLVLIPALIMSVMLLTVGTAAMTAMVPAVGQAREAAKRTQCKNNLKQIALALHTYHDAYGSFPPAYLADDNGKPMHSWRVLILPFIEQRALYDRYDFTKPWDAPENRNVLDKMPDIFKCPSHGNTGRGNTTHYAAVTGPNCTFDGTKALRIRDIKDGAANVVMVGEAVGAEIPWTSPVDIDITQHPALGNPNGFSSDHNTGDICQFVCADGHVVVVSKKVDQQTLDRLYRIDDGNPANF